MNTNMQLTREDYEFAALVIIAVAVWLLWYHGIRKVNIEVKHD